MNDKDFPERESYDGFRWTKDRERVWHGVTADRRFVASVEELPDAFNAGVFVCALGADGDRRYATLILTAEFQSLPLAQDGAAVMLREWLTAASDELGAVS